VPIAPRSKLARCLPFPHAEKNGSGIDRTVICGGAEQGAYRRESNDTPSEKAFCRVAPSVLLSDFAILVAGVF
jgi:hypothetical protein